MLTVKAEAMAGTDISEACYQMVVLARKIDCIVEIDFNGVLLIAYPTTTPLNLVNRYHEAMERGGPHPIAIASE